MKAAVYHGRKDVRIETVPDPRRPNADEVLLKVLCASICGTDVAEYLSGPHVIPITLRHPVSGHLGPLIIGHEFVGRVMEAGSGVAGLAPGDRVVVGAGMWCGACDWCRAGRPNLCARSYTVGLHVHGGLSEMVTVPALMCRPVPAQLPDEHAAVAQPMAVALHAVRRAGGLEGKTVAIIGIGGIGSFILAAAAARGAKTLMAVEVSEPRLALAARIAPRAIPVNAGGDAASAVLDHTGGRGADVVLEASGSAAGLGLAPRVVCKGGRLLLVGLQTEPRTVDVHDLVIREVDIVCSNAHVCDDDLPEALDRLTASDLGTIVIHKKIALPDLVAEGLDPQARGQTHGKIVVQPTT